jgi:hypothetical protein
MDGSVLFDPQYLPIIIVTLVGFGLLAAALLVPIWRFLQREEEVAEKWTPDRVAEQLEIVRKKREAEEADASEEDDATLDGPDWEDAASGSEPDGEPGSESGAEQTEEEARES